MNNRIINSILQTARFSYNDLSEFMLKFKFDSLKIFLILVCTTLYLPHCFILNEDLGLMISYNNDSGTISEAIIGLLDNYNFYDHMHSRYYGWTYFFINFIFLKPIQIFLDLFNYGNNTQVLLFCIKLLFFAIGTLSLIAFNEVLLKIFRNNFYALLGSMLYLLGRTSHVFYYIHPESTGLLFMFLSILCLLNFLERPDRYKYYIYGLAFLVLSSLSKQIFFFTSLPILAIFVIVIFNNEKVSFKHFVTSKKFIDLTKHSLLVTFIILLIINPFLIFDLKNAFQYQIQLLNYHNKDDGHFLKLLPHDKVLILWMICIYNSPIATFYFVSFPLTYFAIIYKIRSSERVIEHIAFLIMLISIYIIFIAIYFGNRLYVSYHFIVPLHPFFILYTLLLIKYFSKTCRVKIIISLLLLMLCTASLTRSIYMATMASYDRFLNYKETIEYKTYQYVLDNFDEDDRIIYNMPVAIPKKMSANTCTIAYNDNCLKELDANYIIIEEDYMINGIISTRLEEVIEFIKNNKMKLHAEITNKKSKRKISVFKKLR